MPASRTLGVGSAAAFPPVASVPAYGKDVGFLLQSLLALISPYRTGSLGCEGASVFCWEPALEVCQLPAFLLMPLFVHCPYSVTPTNPTAQVTLLRQLKARASRKTCFSGLGVSRDWENDAPIPWVSTCWHPPGPLGPPSAPLLRSAPRPFPSSGVFPHVLPWQPGLCSGQVALCSRAPKWAESPTLSLMLKGES